MNSQIWYNNQHVASEDLEQIYIDCEQLMLDHIYDFHYSSDQFILASQKYGEPSFKVVSQTFPSLTVQISSGVAYQSQKRVEMVSSENFTITNPPPNYGTGFTITRIDLIYLTISEIDKYPFALDFIDPNRNIYQQTVYTRRETSYTINQQAGVYNSAGATKPSIPTGGIALAYIHMRDGTNKIYNSDTSQLNEGWIEDTRNLIIP